jgi:hypothetical protein
VGFNATQEASQKTRNIVQVIEFAILINCLAYIDLNPVRAGIVEKPEEYRWNSTGYHVQTNNKDRFLSLDFGLKEFNVVDADERLRLYRKFLYEKGSNTAEKGSQIA